MRQVVKDADPVDAAAHDDHVERPVLGDPFDTSGGVVQA